MARYRSTIVCPTRMALFDGAGNQVAVFVPVQ